jgi:hypothetical protein
MPLVTVREPDITDEPDTNKEPDNDPDPFIWTLYPRSDILPTVVFPLPLIENISPVPVLEFTLNKLTDWPEKAFIAIGIPPLKAYPLNVAPLLLPKFA